MLILILALQAAVPYATDLPPDSTLAPRHPRAAAIAPSPSFPALGQADVFDPSRQGGGPASAAGGDGGALQVMGVVSSGRGAAALMKAGGAAAAFVRPGGAIAGWRLVSVGGDAVWVQKGGQKRRLRIGAPPPDVAAGSAPAAPPADPGDQSQ